MKQLTTSQKIQRLALIDESLNIITQLPTAYTDPDFREEIQKLYKLREELLPKTETELYQFVQAHRIISNLKLN